MNNFSCIITGTLSRNLSWNLEMLYWQKIYSWIYFIVYFSVTYNVLQSGYCVSLKKGQSNPVSHFLFLLLGFLCDVAFSSLCSISVLYAMKEETSLINHPLRTPDTWLQ